MKAQIWKVSGWIEHSDAAYIENVLEKMLNDSGFKILERVSNEFQPFGYTALWLLSESHLALHTFPEENKSYFELSSCLETKYQFFTLLLNKSELKWQSDRKDK